MFYLSVTKSEVQLSFKCYNNLHYMELKEKNMKWL